MVELDGRLGDDRMGRFHDLDRDDLALLDGVVTTDGSIVTAAAAAVPGPNWV